MVGGRSGVEEKAAAEIKGEGNNALVIAVRPTTIIESRENNEKVIGNELTWEISSTARRGRRRVGATS
jgi:hypothetical protein